MFVINLFQKRATIAILLAKVLQPLNDSVMIFCFQMIPAPANVENHWNPRQKWKLKHLNAEPQHVLEKKREPTRWGERRPRFPEVSTKEHSSVTISKTFFFSIQEGHMCQSALWVTGVGQVKFPRWCRASASSIFYTGSSPQSAAWADKVDWDFTPKLLRGSINASSWAPAWTPVVCGQTFIGPKCWFFQVTLVQKAMISEQNAKVAIYLCGVEGVLQECQRWQRCPACVRQTEGCD